MARLGRRSKRSLVALGLLAGVLVLGVGSAGATPGTLDTSFGTGGTVTTAFDGEALAGALVLQPDGKLVAAGPSDTSSGEDFGLVRYNPDGSLDTSFGTDGTVTTAIGPFAGANALVLQPDGKLVAVGFSHNGSTSEAEFALARYNPDGSLDTSFGTDGTVTTAIGQFAGAIALVLQPDGKLVVAGFTNNGSLSTADFVLVRYNPDGSLDTSFGTDGTVTTAIGVATALVLQPDGKLVAAGFSRNGEFALARYTPDGSLDTSFGTDGTVTTRIGNSNDAYALVLQPDGKLVVAGSSTNEREDFALVRYNPNGSLDTSFGTDGTVTTAIGSEAGVNALVLQPDGKLVAAGFTNNGSPSHEEFALVRYNPDGSLDTSFGTTMTAIGLDAGAYALVLQPDGKPVAAGFSNNSSGEDFALARYLSSSSTLTVSKRGAGRVTSSPAGIACGSTCSAPFAAVPVTLTATPAAGSAFTGWSGGSCSGTGACTVTMSRDRSLTANFARLCVVPQLKHRTLRAAKSLLRRANCSLGKVRAAHSRTVKKGRVIAQKPPAKSKRPPHTKVNLKLSKGKPRNP